MPLPSSNLLILVKENFQLTVAVRLMPPLSFFLKPILGGLLFRRIPNPSSSFSMIFLWPRGFSTSRTIRMRLQVRATKHQKKKVTSQKACSHNLRQNYHNMARWTLKPLRGAYWLFLNACVGLKLIVLAKHH